MYTMTEKDIRRFQDSCYFDDEGILRWGGSIKTTGYGRFGFGGQMVSAHRVAYFLWGASELRPEDHVLHDNSVVGRHNRNIVDVRYLRIGDHKQNMRDMAAAGSLKGENHGGTDLTSEQVLDIYRRAWAGHGVRGVGKALAEEFGVKHNTISNIKYGKRWSHITGHVREELATTADLAQAAD